MSHPRQSQVLVCLFVACMTFHAVQARETEERRQMREEKVIRETLIKNEVRNDPAALCTHIRDGQVKGRN